MHRLLLKSLLVKRLTTPGLLPGVTGSIPVQASADVVFSLTGKALHCACKEQGSSPGNNQCGLVYR
jgi:hypothetical protein